MLVIDSDDYSAAGIATMFFPGGEPHVKLPTIDDAVLLHLKLRTWADTGFAALLMDALCRQGGKKPIAFIPYFPGARQDRTEGTAALTVHIMARLLAQSCCEVWVFDPHSPRTQRETGASVMMPKHLDLPVRPGVVGIIAPDAGAKARAHEFRDAFYPTASVVECSKVRDQASGRLSNYQMPGLTTTGNYIIVDDICDGGGTFNLLAEAFESDPLAPDCELELFASHGIFSKGLGAIDPAIRHITTTDSWCCLPGSDRLTVIPLLPDFLKYAGVRHA